MRVWRTGKPLVVSIKPRFFNCFMKTWIRGLVVPTMLASMSWLIFSAIGSDVLSSRRIPTQDDH